VPPGQEDQPGYLRIREAHADAFFIQVPGCILLGEIAQVHRGDLHRLMRVQ